MILSGTTRAGITAFMKALSTQVAPFGITANVVAPGGVLTGRLIELLEAKSKAENRSYEVLLKESEKSIPLGRFATPDELAKYVVFLCSNEALYVTGTNTNIDGGLSRSVG